MCNDINLQVFCECDCQSELGMESGDIPADRISALVSKTQANYARLNNRWSWTATKTQAIDKQWLQVYNGISKFGHLYIH